MLNIGLDIAVIEENSICRNRERGMRVGNGLSMIVTYTWEGNDLGIHLRYSYIM